MSAHLRAHLRAHLVGAGLAGAVATPPSSTAANCARLADGHPIYHFGLSDWTTASADDALGAVHALCGTDPVHADPDPDGLGWIDPDATLAGIDVHRRRLASAAQAGERVLFATGHPTGLLAHYMTLARWLRDAGVTLLTPLDDQRWRPPAAGLVAARGLRFLDGVGAVFDGGALLHTHRAEYMEAMLDELGDAVDLVVADHGMAGAAIQRGISTLSIADVNDPALPLAQARGRTDGVLVIDDNLAPAQFVAVTTAMLVAE